MNKLSFVGGVIAATVVSFSVWANNPCMPIAEACMEAGYYKGGNKVGKGLVENCVMPVAAGTKTLPNTNFSSTVLQQCHATIATRMNSQGQ
jgi:hypothetical protein